MLKEALIGCALTDATLRQGLLNDSNEVSDSLAEQAVLNAVVALLEADVIRQAEVSHHNSRVSRRLSRFS